MKKNKFFKSKLFYFLLSSLFLLAFFSNATLLVHDDQTDFDLGTYVNTYYNLSVGAVMLYGNNLTGNYTSSIIATGYSNLRNISWSSNSGEMPNNGGINNWINMTGNVFLLHLNNETGENSTFFKDYSGRGNNFSCSGSSCPILNNSGRIGKGYKFDGGDFLLNTSFINITSSAFSGSYWFYHDTLTSDQGHMGQHSDGQQAWLIEEYTVSSCRHFSFQVSEGVNWFGTRNNCTTILAGQWNHLSFTWDGVQTGRMYINGNLVETATGMTGFTNSVRIPFRISGTASNAVPKFTGLMDEIAIWNRSLSASEISALYASGATRLNLSVRSCDDALCSGESFTNLGIVSSPQNLTLENNTYFQYKFDYSTINYTVSPKLYNITLDYSSLKIGFYEPTAESNSYFNRDYIYVNVSVSSQNESNMTFYLYNSSHYLLNSTFSNLSLRELNWTDLSEGEYYYNVTLVENDSSSYSTETRIITLDRTNPYASLISPQDENITANSQNYYMLNFSDNIGLKNVTLYLLNQTGGEIIYQNTETLSEGNTSGNTTLVLSSNDGIYNWFIRVNDFASNNYMTGNRTITVDTTNSSVSNFLISLNNSYDLDPNRFVEFNITAIDLVSGVKNVTLFYKTGDLVVEPENFSYQLNDYDYFNYGFCDEISSEVCLTRDSSGGIFNSYYEGGYDGDIDYTEWSQGTCENANSFGTWSDQVRPNVYGSAYFNAPNNDPMCLHLTDGSDLYFDIVYESWTQGASGGGFNYTRTQYLEVDQYSGFNSSTEMNLIDVLNGIYSTNLTTINNETNYSFYVSVEDNASNIYRTNVTSLESAYERYWNISLTFDEVAGRYDQNKYIGNLTIINHADFSFTYYSVRDNLNPDGLIYDDQYIGYVPQFTLASNSSYKENRTILINHTFYSTSRTDSITITVKTNSVNSSYPTLNLSYNATSFAGGPFFDLEITNYLSSVNQSSSFNLTGLLENIGDDYAYNISMNWTLPSGFEIEEGNESLFIENISAIDLSDNYFNSSNLNVSLGSDVSAGSYNIILSVLGNDGENITEYVNKSTSVSITVYCSLTDGVCGSGCTYEISNQFYDSDCSAPESSNNNGGGSGGGGISTSGGSIKTKADYTIVRGKQNEIYVLFENKKSIDIINLSFNLSGDIAKYIEVFPNELDILKAYEKVNLTLKITSPTYLSLGRHDIILQIRGIYGESKYLEDREIAIQVNALSSEDAKLKLVEIEELLSLLGRELSLSPSDKLNDIYEDAKFAFDNFEYEIVYANYEIIKKAVENALSADKKIIELKKLIEQANEKEISTDKSERLVKLSELSMKQGEYELAYRRASEAQLAFAAEVKGEIGSLKYYVKKYPGQIGGAALLTAIITLASYKVVRYANLKRKARKLKKEDEILVGLIKTVQDDTFKKKKTSMEEYREAMLQYEKRMSQVVEELMNVETQITHAFKFTKYEKKLNIEKKKILDMIKQLQIDYMQKGKIETRAYELKFESYNRRLGEIDEKLAEIEAKEEIRRFEI